MKLTLLRHGDTAGSRDDLYYGAADIHVLPDSLEMLAERAKTGVYPTAARYYTSGLLRTEQTIRALYGDVPHTQLPGLREMDFGDFEMKSYAELKDDPAFQTWCQDAERRRHRRAADAVVRRHPVRLSGGAGYRVSGDVRGRQAGILPACAVKIRISGAAGMARRSTFPFYRTGLRPAA